MASVTAPRNSGADLEARQRQRVVAARERGSSHERAEPEDGSKQIEPRVERRTRVGPDRGRRAIPDRGAHPRRRDADPPPANRAHERDDGGQHHEGRPNVADRGARSVVAQPDQQACETEDPEHAAQQPSVPDSQLPTPGGDPAEEQAARRPLDEDRRKVELHGQSTMLSSRDTRLRRSGPPGAATTMSSRRIPKRPGT